MDKWRACGTDGATSQIARSVIRPSIFFLTVGRGYPCHFSDRSLSDPTATASPDVVLRSGATSQIARSVIRRLHNLQLAIDLRCHFSDRSLSDPTFSAVEIEPEDMSCHFSDRSLSDPTLIPPEQTALTGRCHFSDRSLSDPTLSARRVCSSNTRATSQIARSVIRRRHHIPHRQSQKVPLLRSLAQ